MDLAHDAIWTSTRQLRADRKKAKEGPGRQEGISSRGRQSLSRLEPDHGLRRDTHPRVARQPLIMISVVLDCIVIAYLIIVRTALIRCLMSDVSIGVESSNLTGCHFTMLTDGLGTPDPNPTNLVNLCFADQLVNVAFV